MEDALAMMELAAEVTASLAAAAGNAEAAEESDEKLCNSPEAAPQSKNVIVTPGAALS
jgi:hypothetical protein